MNKNIIHIISIGSDIVQATVNRHLSAGAGIRESPKFPLSIYLCKPAPDFILPLAIRHYLNTINAVVK